MSLPSGHLHLLEEQTESSPQFLDKPDSSFHCDISPCLLSGYTREVVGSSALSLTVLGETPILCSQHGSLVTGGQDLCVPV